MNKVKESLRVLHFPQIGTSAESFNVSVKDEEEAHRIMVILADQHLWLFANNFIPDYSNTLVLEMLNDEDGWVEYYNEKEEMYWEEFVETYFENNPIF